MCADTQIMTTVSVFRLGPTTCTFRQGVLKNVPAPEPRLSFTTSESPRSLPQPATAAMPLASQRRGSSRLMGLPTCQLANCKPLATLTCIDCAVH